MSYELYVTMQRLHSTYFFGDHSMNMRSILY